MSTPSVIWLVVPSVVLLLCMLFYGELNAHAKKAKYKIFFMPVMLLIGLIWFRGYLAALSQPLKSPPAGMYDKIAMGRDKDNMYFIGMSNKDNKITSFCLPFSFVSYDGTRKGRTKAGKLEVSESGNFWNRARSFKYYLDEPADYVIFELSRPPEDNEEWGNWLESTE